MALLTPSLTKLRTDTHPIQHTPRVQTYRKATGHGHTHRYPNPRRAHTLDIHQLQSLRAHIQHHLHTYTPLTNHQTRRSPRTRHGGRGGLHLPQETHITHPCPIHTNKNPCGECTSPVSSHTAPPCAAPCVANSPATAIWPVIAPLCLA
jgi:hypothetical protein